MAGLAGAAIAAERLEECVSRRGDRAAWQVAHGQAAAVREAFNLRDHWRRLFSRWRLRPSDLQGLEYCAQRPVRLTPCSARDVVQSGRRLARSAGLLSLGERAEYGRYRNGRK